MRIERAYLKAANKESPLNFESAALHYFACFRDVTLEDSYFNRDVEKAFMTASKEMFDAKTQPSMLMSNQVGNMYTPSIYGGLASLIHR